MAAAVQQQTAAHTFPTMTSRKSASPKRTKSLTPSLEESDRLPSPEELEKSGNVPVYDKHGESILFKDLYNQHQRHLIIFVRHFFCGMCQDYIRVLGSSISPSDLSNLSQPTQISIIGCGSTDIIEDYASYTQNCQFTIYADPSRQLYDQFDMISTLNQGTTKPAYQVSNIVSMVGRNVWQGLSSGSGAMKGGNFSQLGGEMLFEDGKVTWCHRMRNTRDHTEVEELKNILGVNR